MTSDVKIRIGADDKASAKIKRLGMSTKDMSKAFMKAGLAMTAMGVALGLVLAKMVNNYSKAGDAVAKMAKRTGLSTEAVSELKHAVELSGASLEDLEKAVRRVQRATLDATEGGTLYKDALDRIGLSAESFIGMKTEDRFLAVAEGIGKLADASERTDTAFDLFGISGTKLLPMIESGTDGLKAMRQEAHDLNLVFSEESAKAAEDFEDAKTRMAGAMTGLTNTIASALLPEFEKLVKTITEKLNVAMAWLSEHPEVAGAFLKLAIVLGVGGVIFIAIAQLLKMFVALRANLIIIHGLMGPAGWAKLAAGLGISAAAIAGFGALQASAVTNAVPSMDVPGVVPGPVGRPRLIQALGGERFGGRTSIGGGSLTVNFYIEAFMGKEEDARDFARKIHRILREENRVGTVGITI